MSVTRKLKRGSIPPVLAVVFAVSGLVVVRLHEIFGFQDINANGGGIQFRQLNLEFVTYEGFGPVGATASINYPHDAANKHQVNAALLPWSHTKTTAVPAISANIMAQVDSDQIGCRITVECRPRGTKCDSVNA